MSRSLLFIRIRLTTFLLVCTSVGVMAQVLAMAQSRNQRTTEIPQINRTDLSKLLDNLEDTYKVRFNYKSSLLKNVQVENASIQAFKGQIDNKLNELLSDVNLKCEVINANSFVIIPVAKDKKEVINQKQKVTEQSPNVVALADETITGKVVDENGEGIPGVSIIVKGTTRGTTTNAKGEYSISVVDEKSVIALSSIGYEHQNIVVGSRKIINVSLSTSTKGLSEVVVVGYELVRKMN
jgi:TonB-dependent starch-binding outer membrane protein SusC